MATWNSQDAGENASALDWVDISSSRGVLGEESVEEEEEEEKMLERMEVMEREARCLRRVEMPGDDEEEAEARGWTLTGRGGDDGEDGGGRGDVGTGAGGKGTVERRLTSAELGPKDSDRGR